ncbi:MAG: SAM-dependent DNA methyltransferase [Saprospiraceae bacterium]|nr:SAM-dependent DNA methyltransferase [Saprospiraceae bacterium]
MEEKLWDAANHLRSNSTLKASEYATPVLGLIFLKYASSRFDRVTEKSVKEFESQAGRSKKSLPEIYIRNCGFYLPEASHFNYLLNLPGEVDAAKAIIEAMEGIEAHNADLAGTLPKNQYHKIKDNNYKEDPYHILRTLLKAFSTIPVDDEGDLFGKIYEYFLGNFALSEGQKGG